MSCDFDHDTAIFQRRTKQFTTHVLIITCDDICSRQRELKRTCGLSKPRPPSRRCGDGQGLVSVRLNECLQTLEKRCFFASRIRRLALSAGVEFLGEEAFCECTHLEHADLRVVRLWKLGERAFASCRKLYQALLNEGLEKLGESAFANSAIRSIRFPSTLRCVEAQTFMGCCHLKSVELPKTVEHIGQGCFEGSAVERVKLPPALKRIEHRMFKGCANLRHIEISSGAEYIGEECFM